MTMHIGGLRARNVHIAKDVHGAFAAWPGTLTNDFLSTRTGEVDLTFVVLFRRMITMQNFLAVGAGFAVGAFFSLVAFALTGSSHAKWNSRRIWSISRKCFVS
jgi:hypothetical protein